jgi:hypothetical protein
MVASRLVRVVFFQEIPSGSTQEISVFKTFMAAM